MTHYVHPDDRPSEFDGRLWDATPGVCCAAFQLGACPHTEAFDYEDEAEGNPHPVRETGADEVVYAEEWVDEPF